MCLGRGQRRSILLPGRCLHLRLSQYRRLSFQLLRYPRDLASGLLMDRNLELRLQTTKLGLNLLPTNMALSLKPEKVALNLQRTKPAFILQPTKPALILQPTNLALLILQPRQRNGGDR